MSSKSSLNSSESLPLVQRSSEGKDDSATGNYIRRKSSAAKLAIERIVRTRERLWSTTISAFIASIPALLVGFTIGYPSPALLDLGDLPEDFRFNTLLSDLFGSFAAVGALFGGPIAGSIADRWGRKVALLLAGVPYLTGYLLLVYAHFISSPVAFKAVILIGRFVSGIGLGWSCLAVPVYCGEISSAKLRGVYGSFTQLALAAGILVVYGLGSIQSLQYSDIALVAVGIVAAFEVMMVWCNETPRWLLSKGQQTKAFAVLEWLRGPKINIEPEISEMEAAMTEKHLTVVQVLREFLKKSVFIPLVLVLVVMFFQQIGGLNAVSTYGASLFKSAGVSNPRQTALYSIGVSALLATILSVFIVDLAGRKPLLLFSGTGMLVGTVMLGTHFYLTRPSLCANQTAQALDDTANTSCNTHLAPLAIVSLLLFNIAFSLGWGPVPWVLMPELLPQRVRGVASGIATFINWGTAAIVTGFYLEYADAVQTWFAWWSFSVMNLLGVLFVLFFITETKGKTLEDIQRRYEAHD